MRMFVWHRVIGWTLCFTLKMSQGGIYSAYQNSHLSLPPATVGSLFLEMNPEIFGLQYPWPSCLKALLREEREEGCQWGHGSLLLFPALCRPPSVTPVDSEPRASWEFCCLLGGPRVTAFSSLSSVITFLFPVFQKLVEDIGPFQVLFQPVLFSFMEFFCSVI